MDISTFNTLNYAAWKREARLFSPKWTPIDEKISQICFEYANSDIQERAYVRSQIYEDFSFTLLSYSHRMAVFAIRESDEKHIMNGLIALSMVSESHLDPRDWSNIVDPRLHSYAANKIGADINKYLALAIKLAEKSTAAWFEKFYLEQIPLDLSTFEEAAVETGDGFGLISTGRKSNKSSVNIKQAALDITNIIESDNIYMVREIRPADELPSYWLSGISFHDKRAKPSFDDFAVGMEIHAILLVDEEDRSNIYQSLTLWLFEFPKRSSVNSILKISQSTKPKNYTLYVLAENQLLFVVVSRSILKEGKAYETLESIKRYESDLKKVLKKYSTH